MFQSDRLTISHGFDLPRPAADCLDLFTPEGEFDWIPTWAPTFIFPASGNTECGMVFTTSEADGSVTVWTMTAKQPEAGRHAYVRVTPGLRTVALTVVCRPNDADSCHVAVEFVLTGLSEAGNAANRQFAAGFATMIDGWRDLILAYFAKAA